MPEPTFRQLITSPRPPVEGVLRTLGEEIGRACGDGSLCADRAEQASARISVMATTLVGSAPPTAHQAMRALLVTLAGQLRPTGSQCDEPDLGGLRPDLVATRGEGHPLVLAAIGAAVAQRAGLPVVVALRGDDVLLAHPMRSSAGAIDIRRQRLVEAPDPIDPLTRWACPHELAALLLDLVAQRAESFGLRPVHVAACELAVRLPLDSGSLQTRHSELARARSAWN